jgi:hypothetical protein
VYYNGTVLATITTPIAAGNTMSTSVSKTATGGTITIKDVTTKATATGKATAGGTNEQAFDGMTPVPNTAGTGSDPIAHFAAITFTSAKLNGAAPPAASATNLVNAKSVTQILTGALTGTALNSWKATWKHK